MDEPKQVIVVRKDLNMRKGKMCAQVAHASLKVILDYADRGMDEGRIVLKFGPYGPMAKWLFEGRFKKICVYVESEKDLDMIYESARIVQIPCAMIVDSGLTEFNGVPTKTCVAIGPAYPRDIDQVTGHLPLL
jgi:peptidyl-tRNA hydrolase, PTH2 family